MGRALPVLADPLSSVPARACPTGALLVTPSGPRSRTRFLVRAAPAAVGGDFFHVLRPVPAGRRRRSRHDARRVERWRTRWRYALAGTGPGGARGHRYPAPGRLAQRVPYPAACCPRKTRWRVAPAGSKHGGQLPKGTFESTPRSRRTAAWLGEPGLGYQRPAFSGLKSQPRLGPSRSTARYIGIRTGGSLVFGPRLVAGRARRAARAREEERDVRRLRRF